MARWTPWTAEELDYIKNNYGKIPAKQIYPALPLRTHNQVKLKANSFGLKDVRYWRPDDLEYLAENYGTISDQAICKHLNRTKNALHIQVVRKLHINHKVNIYTAREVAALLGVACSKTIIDWKRRGWIEGHRSTIHCGGTFMWDFSYESIEKCLRDRPWLVNCSKMEHSYFQNLVKELFAQDPWYSIYKTCQLISVVYQSVAMTHYIKKKWLHPVKKPCEWGNHWTYVFFKSDIDRFLADDPRRLQPFIMGDSKKRKNFKAGKAVRLLAIFKMKCPQCNKTVRISTKATRLQAPAIKELFIEKYNQGPCKHGRLCQVEEPLKPYKKHRTKSDQK